MIVEKSNKTVTIFELTIPAEHRIKSAHELKFQKYQHFITDIQTYTVKVIPFEIGSHTGYISSDNKKSIHSLHKFCEKNITLKKFTQNISAITVLSSYYIFNARNQDNWETMDTIQAPFNSWNQWNTIIHSVQETNLMPAGGFGIFCFINLPLRF